jgi:hypothetical protein
MAMTMPLLLENLKTSIYQAFEAFYTDLPTRVYIFAVTISFTGCTKWLSKLRITNYELRIEEKSKGGIE